MAKVTVCPKCSGSLDLNSQDSGGRIRCSNCGTMLQVRRRATDQPAPQSPKTSSAAKKGSPRGSGLSTRNAAPENEDPADPFDDLGSFDADDPAAPADPCADDEFDDEADEEWQDVPQLPPARRKKVTRPAAKVPRATPASMPVGLILGVGAAGVTILVIAVLIGVRFLLPDAADGNANVVPGATELPRSAVIAGLTSAPVLIDQPVAGVQAAGEKPVSPPWFTAGEPFDESTPVALPVVDEAHLPPAKPVFDDAARWTATADPPPSDVHYELSPDLEWTFPRSAVPGKSGYALPIPADLNGPFILVPPVWEEWPYKRNGDGDTSDAGSGAAFAETPQPPIAVVDLRSGQPAGAFHWQIPFWLYPALSPDGQYLLGAADPVYHADMASAAAAGTSEAASMFVWQRDSDNPPHALSVPGYVSWYGFLADERAGLLLETPRREF